MELFHKLLISENLEGLDCIVIVCCDDEIIYKFIEKLKKSERIQLF